MFVDQIREMLLSLPISHVMLSVFLTACAIGGACICACVAARALPEVWRDFQAWRLDRKVVLEGQPAWINTDTQRGCD